MEKNVFEQEVTQQKEIAATTDWATLNESDLAVVGGGCAESTPY